MKNGIIDTETVMKRYIPVLADILAILSGHRGSHHISVRGDDIFLNWMDNMSVLFMSSAHTVNSSEEYRRWSKKEKEHIQMKRPFIVKSYNDKMGGIDLCDQMLSFFI